MFVLVKINFQLIYPFYCLSDSRPIRSFHSSLKNFQGCVCCLLFSFQGPLLSLAGQLKHNSISHLVLSIPFQTFFYFFSSLFFLCLFFVFSSIYSIFFFYQKTRKRIKNTDSISSFLLKAKKHRSTIYFDDFAPTFRVWMRYAMCSFLLNTAPMM